MSTAVAAVQHSQPFRYAVLKAAPMTDEGDQRQAVPAHLRQLEERLDAMGGLQAGPGTAGALEAAREAASVGQPLALLHATGGTEAAALELMLAHRAAHVATAEQAGDAALLPDLAPPLLLLAHPLTNSLPSALETLARMQQEGQRGRICYLPSAAAAASTAEDDGWGVLRSALHSVRVWHALARSRIGLVGRPSDWLVASVPSGKAVRAAWGPTLAEVGMGELMSRLLERADDGDDGSGGGSGSGSGSGSGKAELEAAVADLQCSSAAPVAGCCVPCSGKAAPAAAVYLALRDLVATHGLSAVTVRCFDIVSELRTSGCYALARLLDEGVVAGCEGDVCAALGERGRRRLQAARAWKFFGDALRSPSPASPASYPPTHRHAFWQADDESGPLDGKRRAGARACARSRWPPLLQAPGPAGAAPCLSGAAHAVATLLYPRL